MFPLTAIISLKGHRNPIDWNFCSISSMFCRVWATFITDWEFPPSLAKSLQYAGLKPVNYKRHFSPSRGGSRNYSGVGKGVVIGLVNTCPCEMPTGLNYLRQHPVKVHRMTGVCTRKIAFQRGKPRSLRG
jgi:hypothetical protein